MRLKHSSNNAPQDGEIIPEAADSQHASTTKHNRVNSIDNPEPDRVYHLTDDFTFCRPSRIVIDGCSYQISSWKGALCALMEHLYETDDYPLLFYIENDFSQHPIFAQTPEVYPRPIMIAEDIFIGTPSDTRGLMKVCRRLLDIYRIPYDEVQIFLSQIAAK